MAPKKRTTRASPATTTTTTSVTNAQLKALIDKGVADALAARDADRSMDGIDSHNSGTGVRRNERVIRECTYPDFMKYQPLNFKGTEGVVELTQWTVGHDVAYAMTWAYLKKKMIDKYCPRGEIKKLEVELWNLKVKGIDVIGYNQRFQELALLCVRMFLEESDKIEIYVGVLPDMIHRSVVASKPKTMQEAIEMATELIDKKIRTFAERQIENKRKQDDNNNQAQQQPPKKQGVCGLFKRLEEVLYITMQDRRFFTSYIECRCSASVDLYYSILDRSAFVSYREWSNYAVYRRIDDSKVTIKWLLFLNRHSSLKTPSTVTKTKGQEIGIHLNTKIQQEVEERKNLKLWSFTKWTQEPEALVFHKMDTEEDSDRYIEQCFVNGLYASDGEINLEKNDNLISNDYAVKLCLEYEVRKGKKLVKKELMVLLRGEIYFVQFIINPEEDEFEPRLIFERSFLRSTNAIVNFGEGTITIQPDFDLFLLSSDEKGKPNLDDLETFLDFDFDEVPQTETDLPPMVCKIGKGSRNKKKVMENIVYFNNSAGPSSSIRIPLTQEGAEKRALAHNIGIRLDGMINPEEEKAMEKIKRKMIKEKKDLGAFIFPIRINEQLGRDDIMKEDRNITMINHTESEVTSRLVNVLCQVGFTTLSAKFLILEIHVDRDAPIVVGRGFLDMIGGNIDIPNRIFTTFEGCTRQTFRAAKSEKIRIAESDSDDEEGYTSGAYDHEARSSRAKRSRNVETVEEALLPDVHHKFLEWRGCSKEAKSRYNSRSLEEEEDDWEMEKIQRNEIVVVKYCMRIDIRNGYAKYHGDCKMDDKRNGAKVEGS
ncbi:hypothetical protein Tco_1237556 [Tanacetum coccineum]